MVEVAPRSVIQIPRRDRHVAVADVDETVLTQVDLRETAVVGTGQTAYTFELLGFAFVHILVYVYLSFWLVE